MFTTTFDSFARPADTDAYADGDLVANDTTAGNVTPLTFSTNKVGGRGKITRLGLFTDNQAVANADFFVHLFSQSPTPSNGDNGSFAVSSAEHWLGSVECDMTTAGLASSTDKIEWFSISPAITFDLRHVSPDERRLYGLIEADQAYTPASGETFKVILDIEGDNG